MEEIILYIEKLFLHKICDICEKIKALLIKLYNIKTNL